MRRRWRAALASLGVALCAGTGHAQTAKPVAPEDALTARLDRVLASRALRDTRVSALVVDAETGSTLYERAADRVLTPASNMKILTAIAALDAFGPSYQFETPIAADRAPDAHGRVGTLYVRGSGDPALTSEDWWRLAAELRSAGLRGVDGDLVLDDGLFDAERWHRAWGPVSSRAYHAPVGALMANYGSFAVTVRPGAAPGRPADVDVTPPIPYLRYVNRAVTGAAGERSTLVVGRGSDGSGLIVRIDGRVPAHAAPKTYYRSVLDPARYAGEILRMHLEALGVAIGGEIRVAPAPEEAVELMRFEGRPMGDIVRLFMKWSNNTVAEALVKAMGVQSGARGTWGDGVPAMRARLEQLGIPLDGATIVDGSGLSYQDRISPRTLVAALRTARASFSIGPEFTAALPIAARDGTLEKRANGADLAVRAKTGLLNRITALSGYARLAGDRVAAFSLIVNGYRVSDDAAIDAMDAFAAALVGG